MSYEQLAKLELLDAVKNIKTESEHPMSNSFGSLLYINAILR